MTQDHLFRYSDSRQICLLVPSNKKVQIQNQLISEKI